MLLVKVIFSDQTKTISTAHLCHPGQFQINEMRFHLFDTKFLNDYVYKCDVVTTWIGIGVCEQMLAGGSEAHQLLKGPGSVFRLHYLK